MPYRIIAQGNYKKDNQCHSDEPWFQALLPGWDKKLEKKRTQGRKRTFLVEVEFWAIWVRLKWAKFHEKLGMDDQENNFLEGRQAHFDSGICTTLHFKIIIVCLHNLASIIGNGHETRTFLLIISRSLKKCNIFPPHMLYSYSQDVVNVFQSTYQPMKLRLYSASEIGQTWTGSQISQERASKGR